MIFSNSDLSKYELQNEQTLADGTTIYHYRYGSINIKVTSNTPSEAALNRAASIINDIAINHVDKESEEDVGRPA